MNENELDTNQIQEDNFDKFIDEFALLLKKYKIDNHIICCTHPDKPDPIVHYNSEYESAKLAAFAHKILKQIILEKID